MVKRTHSPHDRFVKSFLSDIEVARDYFAEFLPDSLLRIINLDRLSHSGTSFISGVQKEIFADVVFRCSVKGQEEFLYFSLLFEHKSDKYEYVSIQFGNYLFGAYQQQLKEKNYPLIPVIPFLYYHGSEQWHPRDMHELFEDYPSLLKKYIPYYKIIFRNIVDYPDERLLELGNALLASALLTQKCSNSPEELLTRFKSIFSILES